MSPSDSYLASQKHTLDVFDHITDSLAVFLVTVISFALKFTFLGLSVKAFYSRALPASLTLSPTSSQSHPCGQPHQTSGFFLTYVLSLISVLSPYSGAQLPLHKILFPSSLP